MENLQDDYIGVSESVCLVIRHSKGTMRKIALSDSIFNVLFDGENDSVSFRLPNLELDRFE